MDGVQVEAILKRFEAPDEVREMTLGRFELVHIGGLTIGRASYQPGWIWSQHVGKALGQRTCQVEHVGLVVSGRSRVVMDDGREFEMSAGDLFAIGPGHDSIVVGDEPYVSLHFVGASGYATKEPEPAPISAVAGVRTPMGRPSATGSRRPS